MSERFCDQDIVFSNGSAGEPVRIISANPVNYAAVMSGVGALPEIEIDAKLFRPTKPSADLLPLVIVAPGSVGVAVSHLAHAETLTDMGIAALVIDPFGARSVTTTVANQTQFSFAASAYDVLAALRFAVTLPGIDPSRIGAQGHSRGGTAVLTAAMRQYSDAVRQGDEALKAVYSVYPWAGHQFVMPHTGHVQTRIVIGERDNWCSPQQAQGYAQAIGLAGGDISFRLFPDAEHSFDRQPPIEVTEDASVAPNAPTIYIDEVGGMIHPVSGMASTEATDRDMMVYGLKAGFGVTGASLGGKGDQPAEFTADMTAFWRDALLN